MKLLSAPIRAIWALVKMIVEFILENFVKPSK